MTLNATPEPLGQAANFLSKLDSIIALKIKIGLCFSLSAI